MNFFQKAWKLLHVRERKFFCLFAFLDLLINLIDIVSLGALLVFVQAYIQPQQTAHVFIFPVWVRKIDPVTGIGIFFFIFCVKNLFAIIITTKEYDFIGGIAVRISALNLSYYQQGGFTEYVDHNSSVQIRKIAFQPFEFCQYLVLGIQQILTQSSLIVISLTGIILLNAKIFLLLLLILLPPVIVVFFLTKRKLSSLRSGIRFANEKSFEYLLDALKGYVESNIYNKNEFFKKRFLRYRKKFSGYLFGSLSLQSIPSRILEMFAVAGLFILIFISKSYGAGETGFFMIGAFMVAAYKIIPGSVKLINTVGLIKSYEHSLDELVQEINFRVPETKNPPVNFIEFRNVSFKYAELTLLQQMNFLITQSDFVGITGRSGRGKTTLINILLGLLPASDGEIYINGVSVNQHDIKNFWPSIGYVKQEVFLINDSIEMNITLDEENTNQCRLDAALKISGLNHFVSQFKEGVEKKISENGKNISGGQQQRIAIARALYKKADVLILDEPFNELDEASQVMILEHLKEQARAGTIVMIITHDKKTLNYCNKIISLDAL